MTTLGKILVFLTFAAALAMGGLMIYLAKASPPWKQMVEDRDLYIQVQKANITQEQESRKKAVTENEVLKKQFDAAMIENRAERTQLKLQLEEKEKERKKYERQFGEIKVAADLAAQETKRLQGELNFTLKVVEERDKLILQYQTDIVTAKNAEQAAKNVADTTVARNQALLAQLTEKEIYIQTLLKKLQPSAGGAVAAKVNDYNFLNPPASMVKGTVEAVDKEIKTLVKLSVGSDSGVRKDNTLEIYRFSPKVEYLGRLLILEADTRSSTGRLIVQPGMPTPTLRVGDEVASKIQ